MLLTKTLIVLVLMTIFWEDMKSRAVHWFLFPVLALTLLFTEYKISGFEFAITNFIWDLLFITLQLIILTLYFSVKIGRTVNIFSSFLGWGDVLFFVAIAFYFPLLNYIVFYISSLITVLIIWVITQKLATQKDNHIPLAGIQALLFALLFFTEWIWPSVKLNSDEWILNKFFL